MSPLADAYHAKTLEMLALARERNAAVIARLAPVLGASIAAGGIDRKSTRLNSSH